MTQEQIAACLGIAETTLYEKKKQLTEFSEAIKRGKAKGIQTVANALFEAALNGNITAMIFFLKTQAGWKEPVAKEQEHSREELIEIEIANLAERSAYRRH